MVGGMRALRTERTPSTGLSLPSLAVMINHLIIITMNYTSNCCDALIINGDMCSSCKEHCEAVDNTEEEIAGEDDEIDLTVYFDKEQLLN